MHHQQLQQMQRLQQLQQQQQQHGHPHQSAQLQFQQQMHLQQMQAMARQQQQQQQHHQRQHRPRSQSVGVTPSDAAAFTFGQPNNDSNNNIHSMDESDRYSDTTEYTTQHLRPMPMHRRSQSVGNSPNDDHAIGRTASSSGVHPEDQVTPQQLFPTGGNDDTLLHMDRSRSQSDSIQFAHSPSNKNHHHHHQHDSNNSNVMLTHQHHIPQQQHQLQDVQMRLLYQQQLHQHQQQVEQQQLLQQQRQQQQRQDQEEQPRVVVEDSSSSSHSQSMSTRTRLASTLVISVRGVGDDKATPLDLRSNKAKRGSDERKHGDDDASGATTTAQTQQQQKKRVQWKQQPGSKQNNTRMNGGKQPVRRRLKPHRNQMEMERIKKRQMEEQRAQERRQRQLWLEQQHQQQQRHRRFPIARLIAGKQQQQQQQQQRYQQRPNEQLSPAEMAARTRAAQQASLAARAELGKRGGTSRFDVLCTDRGIQQCKLFFDELVSHGLDPDHRLDQCLGELDFLGVLASLMPSLPQHMALDIFDVMADVNGGVGMSFPAFYLLVALITAKESAQGALFMELFGDQVFSALQFGGGTGGDVQISPFMYDATTTSSQALWGTVDLDTGAPASSAPPLADGVVSIEHFKLLGRMYGVQEHACINMLEKFDIPSHALIGRAAFTQLAISLFQDVDAWRVQDAVRQTPAYAKQHQPICCCRCVIS
eukprot:TRINITY_DN66447_c9_g1_i1.p1 TRINITY_DN66447_c9_g1~~TRINITY_DN66447_c9_g1_i1.p1  ORF type:complete len:735 (+),score=365.35 TRINITY_DN66447_c9_g1_i1:99-2207(+)